MNEYKRKRFAIKHGARQGMSQDVPEVPDVFEVPMTFATVEFVEFVEQLQAHLAKIVVGPQARTSVENMWQDVTNEKNRIEKMCELYTKLLARMGSSVRCIRFMYDDKNYYKYDLRACKTKQEELVTSEYQDEQDRQLVFPTWSYLDAYVWRILNRCKDVYRDVYLYDTSFDAQILEKFNIYIRETTDKLNAKKGDIERYICMIESRKQRPNSLEMLHDIWALEKLIPFTESGTLVRERNWYIQPFSFELPDAGRPRDGGGYARIGSFRSRAALVPCDDIGGLLTRMQNL